MNIATAACAALATRQDSSNEVGVVDFATVKQRQRAIWSSGDYAIIGTTLQIVGELLAEAVDVQAGERVLDVAAGNGNATLAAARRFARVTSTDYVPQLLEKAAMRARAEGLDIQFQTEDVEALPFGDGTFDVVLSTFGAMFAPNHGQVAHELLRVARRGGRIGLANWTPEGFIGDLLRLIASHAPPPAGIRSPLLWGTEPTIVELFGAHATEIRCVRRHFNFRYRSAAHWIEIFTNYYGPLHKAYAAMEADRRRQLVDDIAGLLARRNVGGPNSLVVPGEYLEIVIVKD